MRFSTIQLYFKPYAIVIWPCGILQITTMLKAHVSQMTGVIICMA